MGFLLQTLMKWTGSVEKMDNVDLRRSIRDCQTSAMGTGPSEPSKEASASTPESEAALKIFTTLDLAVHNTRSDCLIAIDGYVLDVTDYLSKHPGGASIMLKYGGKDATEAFEDIHHSADARQILKSLIVGKLRAESEATKLEAANREIADVEEQKSGMRRRPAPAGEENKKSSHSSSDTQGKVRILYGSQKGRGKALAEKLASSWEGGAAVASMADFDPEDLPKVKNVALIISTYTDGTAPEPAKFFTQWLKDARHDWRVDKKVVPILMEATHERKP